MAAKSPKVLLVSLPWTSLTEPSPGLGILAACLKQATISCEVLHLNIYLLEHLKATTYYALANVFALNDFLFTGVLEPEITNRQRRLLRFKMGELLHFGIIDASKYGGLEGVIKKVLKLRDKTIPRWLEKWSETIAQSDATLIGMTCMYDQTIASLALAKLIKDKSPDKIIALGGYAVHTPTGEALLRSFPCIDAICNGEGEPSILGLAQASIGERPFSDIPNLLYRDSEGRVLPSQTAPPVDMNEIPTPDYDDFFKNLHKLSEKYQVVIRPDRLPVENSRGCWWGQNNHCVFCGIRDEDLHYRFRKAELVLNSLEQLSEKYQHNHFRFSDYILPYDYFKTLLPAIIEKKSSYSISSEIKANIRKDQFELLAKAGFTEVQPGIESFSSRCLQEMNKGVDALQNIYVLLLGKRYGLPIRYNILFGLPSDEPEEYRCMLERIPWLLHLDAPSTRLPIQITRFSPLQRNPSKYHIPASEYEPSYDLIFSSNYREKIGLDLNDFCYYFSRPFENSAVLNNLHHRLEEQIDRWKKEQINRKIVLEFQEHGTEIKINDSRFQLVPEIYKLSPEESRVYRWLLDPQTLENLYSLAESNGLSDKIQQILEGFRARKLLFEDKNKLIGLAIPYQTCFESDYSDRYSA